MVGAAVVVVTGGGKVLKVENNKDDKPHLVLTLAVSATTTCTRGSDTSYSQEPGASADVVV